METESVYCAVGAAPLNSTQVNVRLQRVYRGSSLWHCLAVAISSRSDADKAPFNVELRVILLLMIKSEPSVSNGKSEDPATTHES